VACKAYAFSRLRCADNRFAAFLFEETDLVKKKSSQTAARLAQELLAALRHFRARSKLARFLL
jgi:hypothetical protein